MTPYQSWPLWARLVERAYRLTHRGQIRTLVVRQRCPAYWFALRCERPAGHKPYHRAAGVEFDLQPEALRRLESGDNGA